jgi:RloB-like protein
MRDDNDYDEAWAVCDVDDYDVTLAMATAVQRRVEIALSVPCFEVWLILHLSGRCPGFNNCPQADRYLGKLLHDWDKTDLKFSDFRGGVVSATARAKLLGHPPDANPSAAIWRLIESLRSAPEATN